MRPPVLFLLPTLLLSALAFAGLSAQQGEDPPSEVGCKGLSPEVSTDLCSFPRGLVIHKDCENADGACPETPCNILCTIRFHAFPGDHLVVTDGQGNVEFDQIAPDNAAWVDIPFIGVSPCGDSASFSAVWTWGTPPLSCVEEVVFPCTSCP